MAYNEQLWQDAKKKCRLTDDDVARAKRLGLNPRSLIKNIPSKSEPWKAPVSVWLCEMEEKRNRKAARRKARKAQSSVFRLAVSMVSQGLGGGRGGAAGKTARTERKPKPFFSIAGNRSIHETATHAAGLCRITCPVRQQ